MMAAASRWKGQIQNEWMNISLHLFFFLISTTFSLSLFFSNGQTLIFCFRGGECESIWIWGQRRHTTQNETAKNETVVVESTKRKLCRLDSKTKVGCDGQRLRDRQTKEKSYKQLQQQRIRLLDTHLMWSILQRERESVQHSTDLAVIASARLHRPPASSDPTTFDSINNNNTSAYDKIRNNKKKKQIVNSTCTRSTLPAAWRC